jgi:hypothetical protein
LAHDSSPESSDLFQALLTMLDAKVALALVPVNGQAPGGGNGNGMLQQDLERARHLGRQVELHKIQGGNTETEIARLAREGKYDLVVVNMAPDNSDESRKRLDIASLLRNSPCRVFLSAPPAIPLEPETDGASSS